MSIPSSMFQASTNARQMFIEQAPNAGAQSGSAIGQIGTAAWNLMTYAQRFAYRQKVNNGNTARSLEEASLRNQDPNLLGAFENSQKANLETNYEQIFDQTTSVAVKSDEGSKKAVDQPKATAIPVDQAATLQKQINPSLGTKVDVKLE